MKNLILTISLIFFLSISLNAQTKFEIPENLSLKTNSDYAKYNNDVVNAAKWLEETDLDKETAKRKQVNAFIIQWVSGTPDISVDITERLTKLYGENTELMVLYLASYSRNYIENKDATKFTAMKAGLISIINVYKKGTDIVKNKEMNKAVKANDNNLLDKFITENL